MSEAVQTLPPQEVIDRQTETRTLSDADLIESGAVVLNGVLMPTGEQEERLAKEGSVEPATDSSVAEDAAEQDKTQEKIDEWLDTMPTTIHTWLSRDDQIPRESFVESGYGNSFLTLMNRRLSTANFQTMVRASRALRRLHTIEPIQRELSKKGVTEAATFAPLKGATFGEFSSDSPLADEEAIQFLYETVTPYYRPVVGNIIKLRMMLPKSEADKLREMIESQPDVVRKLIEKLMTEKFQSKEGWERSRPPYETWREANGGVSRIALRDSLVASAEDSKVIEF